MAVEEIVIEPEAIEAIPLKIADEQFSVYPIGVMPYLQFLRIAQSNKDDENTIAVATFDLFESSMEPNEYERFTQYAMNPKNGISIRVMLELISKLVERSANRPSEPSSPSENGS